MSGATVHAFPTPKKERYQTTAARTAKAIRLTLGKAFPGTKFRVISDNFSGGNSVDVKWFDGPTGEMVRSFADRYCHSGFDGMTDCSYSIADAGDEFGNPLPDRVRFVSCERSFSPAFAQVIADAFNQRYRPDPPVTVQVSSYDGQGSFVVRNWSDERCLHDFANRLPFTSNPETLAAWALEAWGQS